MKAKATQFQQGDLVIEKINAIPARAQKQDVATRAIFVEGEGTHVHRAAVVGSVEMYVKDGVRYARVLTDTEIEHVTPDGRHGEHNPITLLAGDYQFGQVNEWDYLNEMAREVVD